MILPKKTLLLDYEYNNINAHKATKVWCASAQDVHTGQRFSWKPTKEGIDEYHLEWMDDHIKVLKEYEMFIGHNAWNAEAVIMKKFFGIDLSKTPRKALDTLALSRVLRPVSPKMELFGYFKKKGWDTRVGGHSLEAWGKRLGHLKIDFDKFDMYTHEMSTYCDGDITVNILMLNVLLKEIKDYGFSEESLWLEQDAHRLFCEQSANGFTLEFSRAKKLAEETGTLIDEYKQSLFDLFPPVKVVTQVYTARYNKDKTMSTASKKKLLRQTHEDNGDGTYNICEMQTFNPDSPQQVGKRLLSLGWNPRKFTATGQPSTSKEVIGEAIDQLAVKYPQVEALRKYNIVSHRNEKALTWIKLATEAGDGRVHGSVSHVGTWTHRCSHYADNMANISKVKLGKDGKPLEGLAGDFGWDSRHCWVPQPGWSLVGYDASGIQLRALAHYMNDAEYIKEVCTGDVHSRNMVAAGIRDRPTSKTFIYAWLLGAGDEKIGVIVGAPEEEWDELFKKATSEFRKNHWRDGTKHNNLLFYVADKLRSDGRIADKQTCATIIKGYFTKKQFLESLPALKTFRTEVIPEATKAGFMYGIDGRKLWIPSEHLAMGAYLQGFEAVIMKWAMREHHRRLKENSVVFRQVAHIHDEAQLECPTEFAEIVGKTAVECIEWAGQKLESLCPLTGEYKVGLSWGETH